MKAADQKLIETSYTQALVTDATRWKAPLKKAVESAIKGLDNGSLRVCEKIGGQWQTHQWLKMAILLYFRLKKIKTIQAGALSFLDKIPLKRWSAKSKVRVVPPAVVRYGAHIADGAVLMPSYVNIGAHVGAGTMVDTWATVGSCAQIGRGVHLSGGVGVGGVLEPLQAHPVVIEDHAFIGSRAILVEGVHVEEGAVIGAGVTITSSTAILDVSGDKEVSFKGRVPAYSVVIPGSRSKRFAAGEYLVPCALIIGKRSTQTDAKTSLTQVLRDYAIS